MSFEVFRGRIQVAPGPDAHPVGPEGPCRTREADELPDWAHVLTYFACTIPENLACHVFCGD